MGWVLLVLSSRTAGIWHAAPFCNDSIMGREYQVGWRIDLRMFSVLCIHWLLTICGSSRNGGGTFGMAKNLKSMFKGHTETQQEWWKGCTHLQNNPLIHCVNHLLLISLDVSVAARLGSITSKWNRIYLPKMKLFTNLWTFAWQMQSLGYNGSFRSKECTCLLWRV